MPLPKQKSTSHFWNSWKRCLDGRWLSCKWRVWDAGSFPVWLYSLFGQAPRGLCFSTVEGKSDSAHGKHHWNSASLERTVSDRATLDSRGTVMIITGSVACPSKNLTQWTWSKDSRGPPQTAFWPPNICVTAPLFEPYWVQKQASQVAYWVKNLTAVQKTQESWVQSPGQGDHLEEGMETHSSVLAWRIPWTEEPGSLQSIGLQRVRCDWAHTHAHRLKNAFLKWVLPICSSK